MAGMQMQNVVLPGNVQATLGLRGFGAGWSEEGSMLKAEDDHEWLNWRRARVTEGEGNARRGK